MSTTEPPTDPPGRTKPARRAAVSSRAIEFAGVVLATVVYPILSEFDVRSADPPTAAGMLLTMPAALGMAALVCALLIRSPGRPLRPREDWRSPRSQLALALSLMFGIWLVEMMFRIVLRGLGIPHYPSPWAAAFKDPTVVAVFPLTALVGVFYEEAVFRAYLLTRLTALVGSAPALLLSALCFAAIHVSYSPLARTSVLLFGLLYGVAWLGTRSLTALVLAHWGHDVIVLLLAKP